MVLNLSSRYSSAVFLIQGNISYISFFLPSTCWVVLLKLYQNFNTNGWKCWATSAGPIVMIALPIVKRKKSGGVYLGIGTDEQQIYFQGLAAFTIIKVT